MDKIREKLTQKEFDEIKKILNCEQTTEQIMFLESIKNGKFKELIKSFDIDETNANYILTKIGITEKDFENKEKIDQILEKKINEMPQIDKNIINSFYFSKINLNTAQKLMDKLDENHYSHNRTDRECIKKINESDLSLISSDSYSGLGYHLSQIEFKDSNANLDMTKIYEENRKNGEKEDLGTIGKINGNLNGCNIISFDGRIYSAQNMIYRNYSELFSKQGYEKVLEVLKKDYTDEQFKELDSEGYFDFFYEALDSYDMINIANKSIQNKLYLGLINRLENNYDVVETNKIKNALENIPEAKDEIIDKLEQIIEKDYIKSRRRNGTIRYKNFFDALGFDSNLKIFYDEVLKNNRRNIGVRRENLKELKKYLKEYIEKSDDKENLEKKAKEYFTKDIKDEKDKEKFNVLFCLGIINDKNVKDYIKNIHDYPEKIVETGKELQKYKILNQDDYNDILQIGAVNSIGISNEKLLDYCDKYGIDIINRIYSSNSELLRGYANELLKGIVKLPKEAGIARVNQAEEIFSDNISPDFIKSFKFFELVVNKQTDKFSLKDVRKVTTSQTLQDIDNEKINKRIILSDLFFSSINSNNKSLKNFVYILGNRKDKTEPKKRE